MHHALGLAMPRHRLLEGADDQLGALGVVDAMPGHEPRAVVDEDQRERRCLMDMPMHEVQVPQVIRAYGLEPLVVRLALDLRRPIAGILHHTPHRRDRHLDPAPTQLVPDLARPQPRVLPPLAEDLSIPLLLDRFGLRTARRRRALARGGLLELALPVVDREPADAELIRRCAHAVRRCVLERLRLLARRVAARDALDQAIRQHRPRRWQHRRWLGCFRCERLGRHRRHLRGLCYRHLRSRDLRCHHVRR